MRTDCCCSVWYVWADTWEACIQAFLTLQTDAWTRIMSDWKKVARERWCSYRQKTCTTQAGCFHRKVAKYSLSLCGAGKTETYIVQHINPAFNKRLVTYCTWFPAHYVIVKSLGFYCRREEECDWRAVWAKEATTQRAETFGGPFTRYWQRWRVSPLQERVRIPLYLYNTKRNSHCTLELGARDK